MTKHADKAVELFKQGYNCSQAVLGAFCEELGVDFNTAMKISSSFGGGMGRMREVCGTVSGMFMVLGIIYGENSHKNKEEKTKLYSIVQELAKKFKEKHNTIICRDLLKGIDSSTSPIPADRTDEYYKKRPCAHIVADAADILEEYLKENSIAKI